LLIQFEENVSKVLSKLLESTLFDAQVLSFW